MKTEAFTDVNEMMKIQSERSNARVGTAAFADTKTKMSSDGTFVDSDQQDVNGGYKDVVQAKGTFGDTDALSNAGNTNTFSHSESTLRQNSMMARKEQGSKSFIRIILIDESLHLNM